MVVDLPDRFANTAYANAAACVPSRGMRAIPRHACHPAIGPHSTSRFMLRRDAAIRERFDLLESSS